MGGRKIGTVADPGGVPRGPWPPRSPVEISHKKMAAKGGHIDFMFLGPSPPLPHPAAGSDAVAIGVACDGTFTKGNNV